MRTSLLTILSFAILAVSLAADGSKAKNETRNFEKSVSKDILEESEKTPSSQTKKSSEVSPEKKQSQRKAKQKEYDEADSGLVEDVSNILKDDISLDQLTHTDPTELGQKINNIRNLKKRKQLVEKLKNAWSQNRRTLPGKFYQAAYVAFQRAKEAANSQNNQLQKEAIKTANDSLERTVLGDSIDIKKISQLGPLGIAML